MSFMDSHSHEPKSGAGKFVVLALIVLAALGGLAYWFLSQAPEPTPAARTEAPPAEPEPEPEPIPIPERADLPTTGTLTIRANVEGASVFVNGTRVGDAPYERADQPAGSVEVRVEKEGYQPFVESVRVRPGRTTELTASLRPPPPTLHVSSDVPGATVFVDREYKGTTPIDITDVSPGEHHLTVSAEGFDMHAESVTVGETGRSDLRISFKDVPLNESIQVVHKHTFGSCEGTLVATNDGIRYETSDKDAFSVPYSQLERFDVDYMDKNLNLKIKGGKNYNFTERNGDADALFLFHKNVQDFLGRS